MDSFHLCQIFYKKNINIHGWGDLDFCGELNFTLFIFYFNASTIVAYIFITPTCKTTIISLEPCALNINF